MLRFIAPMIVLGMSLMSAIPAHALDDEERRLLQEIVKSTQQEFESKEQMYLNGKLYFGDVSDAARRLAEARLNLATSPAERLQLWEDMVKITAQAEQYAQASVHNGMGTTAELHQAHARHLEAQLGLYRTKRAMQTESTSGTVVRRCPTAPPRAHRRLAIHR
jgi:outer membrane protein TolC